jgi:hypothetical protein
LDHPSQSPPKLTALYIRRVFHYQERIMSNASPGKELDKSKIPKAGEFFYQNEKTPIQPIGWNGIVQQNEPVSSTTVSFLFFLRSP